jgi:tetratricopeptide (TPR) repeat protein
LPQLPFLKTTTTRKTNLPKPNLARMIRDQRMHRRRIWIAAGLVASVIAAVTVVYALRSSAGEAELYLAADTYWQQGKYSEAAGYYERLIARYPKGKLREKVLLDAAVTQYLYLRNIHRAIELYRIILQESGDKDLRATARRNLGDIYLRDVGDQGQALEEFKALCAEARTDKDRQEAELSLAEVYFKRNELPLALEQYQRVAEASADPHLAAKANLRIGSLHQLEHNFQAALPAYEAVLAGTPCPECRHQAQMGLLDSYENLERFEEATRVLDSMDGDSQLEAFKTSERRRIEEKKSVLRAESAVNWSDKRNQRPKPKD